MKGKQEGLPLSDFTRDVAGATGVPAEQLSRRAGETDNALIDTARRDPRPEHFANPETLPEDLKEVIDTYTDAQRVLVEYGLVWFDRSMQSLVMRDMHDRHIPVPPKEEIAAMLADDPELYTRKAKQGFNRLLLVPFGMPVDRMFELVGGGLARLSRLNGLADGKAKSVEVAEESLNAARSDFVEGEEEQLYRYSRLPNPAVFNLGKEHLLVRDLANAWRVLLVEDATAMGSVDMRRRHSQGVLQNGAVVPATKEPSASALFSMLRKEPFRGEAGLVIEDYLTMLLDQATRHGRILDVNSPCPLLGVTEARSEKAFDVLTWQRYDGNRLKLRSQTIGDRDSIDHELRTCVPIAPVEKHSPATT